MKNITLWLLLATMLVSQSLRAQNLSMKSGLKKNQMIELYTSQGCSSCPSADKWIADLKNHKSLWKDLVPVAFHVDYWDRLGWKDRFATGENSQRQRNYLSQGNISQVYTPGFVVDGKEWRGFFHRNKLPEQEAVEVGEIIAKLKPGKVTTRFTPVQSMDKPVVFNLAVLGFNLRNLIETGENRGETLDHDFVLLGTATLVTYQNTNVYSAVFDLPELVVDAQKKALVIWVNEVDNLRPIQALGAWL